MSRKKRVDNLESKVFKLSPNAIIHEDKEKYLPFCDYHWHRGLIHDENVCIIRKCRHYHKLYINNLNKVYF